MDSDSHYDDYTADFIANPIRIVTDAQEIANLKLDVDETHLIGSYFNHGVHAPTYCSRSRKLGTRAMQLLQELEKIPLNTLRNDQTVSENNEARGTKTNSPFAAITMSSGDTFYMLMSIAVQTAHAVAEKLDFVHEVIDGSVGLGFVVVPVELTPRQDAVLKWYFNIEFEGTIRLHDDYLLVSDHRTDAMYKNKKRWNPCLKCCDGRKKLYTTASLQTETMKKDYELNKCHSTFEFVVTKEKKILAHYAPHSETQLHHENHSRTSWPTEDIPEPKSIEHYDMLRRMRRERIVNEKKADGYDLYENLIIQRATNGREYVEVKSHRFRRYITWECNLKTCKKNGEKCGKGLSLQNRRGNTGTLKKPKNVTVAIRMDDDNIERFYFESHVMTMKESWRCSASKAHDSTCKRTTSVVADLDGNMLSILFKEKSSKSNNDNDEDDDEDDEDAGGDD